MRTKIATVPLVLIAFLCGGAAPAPTPRAEAPGTSYIPGAIFQAPPGSLTDWIELRGDNRGNNGLIRTASKTRC